MSDFFKKFTKNARKALLIAEQEAINEGSGYIGTEHSLLGIISRPTSQAAQILKEYNITLKKVTTLMKVARTPQATPKHTTINLSGFAKKNIENAIRLAYSFGEENVGTEHILLALIKQKETTAANVILRNLNVDTHVLTLHLEDILKKRKISKKINHQEHQSDSNLSRILGNIEGLLAVVSKQNNNEIITELPLTPNENSDSQSPTPTLDFFATDFTHLARTHKLDPIIARHQEIERIIAIISRKTKNNPCLIGEPGVGKTAIIEGLAQRIIHGDVPAYLLEKRIMSLNLTSIVAGTKFRGEFEQRIKQILTEATKKENDIILFIDELHTIIGTGSAEGSMDFANILKPMLSRGDIQLIGATTLDEYKKYIEKDTALERRFQQVTINEPTPPEAIKIISGIALKFEEFHNLAIEPSAIIAAVELATRYINDRFLPDKAIDLLDETCAQKSMHSRGDPHIIKTLNQQLQTLKTNRDKAVTKQNYKLAGELQEKEQLLLEKIQQAKTTKNTPRPQRQKITAADISKTLSAITGIPTAKITNNEIRSLSQLQPKLAQKIIAQPEATTAIANSIARNRLGLSGTNRPLGSFLFLGPTGVGKTELCRILADEIFGSSDQLIKIDMSEFSEKHNISRLLGATAGYIGYEEGGQLTEKVRQKPYSVILFDEIEKAHPDILNILLQIMEDGELTDGKGRKINFRNTIIILTSNIGAHKFNKEAQKIGFNTSPKAKTTELKNFNTISKTILTEVEEYLLPELLGRIDNLIIFHPLDATAIAQIVKLQITNFITQMAQKNMIITISNPVLKHLTQISFNPKEGARQIRKTITTTIKDQISQQIINHKLKITQPIKITLKNKIIKITN